jgi:hypothetical protein
VVGVGNGSRLGLRRSAILQYIDERASRHEDLPRRAVFFASAAARNDGLTGDQKARGMDLRPYYFPFLIVKIAFDLNIFYFS